MPRRQQAQSQAAADFRQRPVRPRPTARSRGAFRRARGFRVDADSRHRRPPRRLAIRPPALARRATIPHSAPAKHAEVERRARRLRSPAATVAAQVEQRDAPTAPAGIRPAARRRHPRGAAPVRWRSPTWRAIRPRSRRPRSRSLGPGRASLSWESASPVPRPWFLPIAGETTNHAKLPATNLATTRGTNDRPRGLAANWRILALSPWLAFVRLAAVGTAAN